MHTEDLHPHMPCSNDVSAAAVPAVTENSGATSADVALISDTNVSEVLENTAQAATENKAFPVWAEPVPDVASLTAAKDAAAFVAQIFADPSISDTADAEVTTAQPVDAAPVQELPPVPAQWPQGQAQHLQVCWSWGWVHRAWPWHAGAYAPARR